MQLALICHTCNDDAYEITCLPRYFPESVCTGVYGVRYSLFYYLLLEALMQHDEYRSFADFHT